MATASGLSPSDQAPQGALVASPWLFGNPLLDRMSWILWHVPPAVFGSCVLALLLVSLGALGPNDPLRPIMPALLSAPIMPVAFVAMLFVCGFRVGSAVMLGFLIGSLGSDMTLYYVRHGMPKSSAAPFAAIPCSTISGIPNAGSA